MQKTWEFSFAPKYQPLLALGGFRPDNSWVRTDDEGFHAKFGHLTVDTPWSNVKDVRITRDYTAVKAIGPRGSFKDRGATFGTNTRAGVCVCFHDGVTALAGPLLRHPGLTVTVADVEGLEAEVRSRLA